MRTDAYRAPRCPFSSSPFSAVRHCVGCDASRLDAVAVACTVRGGGGSRLTRRSDVATVVVLGVVIGDVVDLLWVAVMVVGGGDVATGVALRVPSLSWSACARVARFVVVVNCSSLSVH
jgi:hypothetical protein